MALHEELQESVESYNTAELTEFLSNLPPSLQDVVHTGFFSEAQLQDAFEAILSWAGATADDWPSIEEAIDGFVSELDEDAVVEGFFSDVLKSAAKGALKGAAGHVAKKITQGAKKGTLGHTLRHAAAGAIKQMGKDPGRAKEIAVKSVSKAASNMAKKGMKMVFGRWAKVGKKAAQSNGKKAAPRQQAPKMGSNTRPSTEKPKTDGAGDWAKANTRGGQAPASGHAKAPEKKSKAPEDTKTQAEVPAKPKKRKTKKPEYVQPFKRAESLADELEAALLERS